MIALKLNLNLNKTKYGEGIKALTIKQMLQRLAISLAQVKAGHTFKMKSDKSYILCIEQEKLLKKYNNIMN